MNKVLLGSRLLLASHSGRSCSAGSLLFIAAQTLRAAGADVKVVFPREAPNNEVIRLYHDTDISIIDKGSEKYFDLCIVNCQALAEYLTDISTSCPTLFWIHEAWQHRNMTAMRKAIQSSTGIILQSEFQRDFVYRIELAQLSSKLFFLSNFAREYDNQSEDERSVSANKILVAVGSMTQRKRISDLVRAVQSFAFEEVRVSIIGKPAMLDDDSRRCIAEESTTYQMLGELDNRSAQLCIRNSDILVHPSAAESQSLVILEGMLHGRCIVAANIESYTYMGLIDDFNFLTYSVGDIRGLGRQIHRALESDELRSRLGRSAKETYNKRFGRERFRTKLINIVSDQLTRGGYRTQI